MLRKVIECIHVENLLSLVTYSGTYLMNGLDELQAEFPNYMFNVRGKGTMVAFTCPTVEVRNTIHRNLLDRGKYIKSLPIFYIVRVKKKNI